MAYASSEVVQYLSLESQNGLGWQGPLSLQAHS